MIQAAASWPLSAWLTLLPLLGGSLAWPASRLWDLWMRNSSRETSRVTTLEDLVELLRRVLDKGRIRENALVSVLTLVVYSLEHLENPPPVITSAKRQGLEILMQAMRSVWEIDQGGKP